MLGSNEEDISKKIENESEQKALLELVKKLNRREKMVLQLRYGLMNSPKRTQREIAKRHWRFHAHMCRVLRRKQSEN
ncbi:RNA polymerase sigma factor [Desulfosporosinus sp. OT]|nr:RNA polymerase sigma factor [Desulfosporosinus sp. OT]